MKKRPYKVIIIPYLVCTAVVAFIGYYATGVIDNSAALSILEQRISAVCDNIDEKMVSYENINEQIYNNYCSRARVISSMLSEDTSIYNDETEFEELSIAVGADVISVTDNIGNIIYSTDMAIEKTAALKEFMPAIKNKVFSDAVITSKDNSRVVVTGTSRLDSPGIIQIEFPLEDFQQQLDRSELSSAVTQMPVMKHGYLAVIDTDTNTYISHTDSFLNGMSVQFPTDKFSKSEGKFSSNYNGKKVLVKYKKHNEDMIVLGIVSYAEIYQRRNTVLKWILFSMTAVTLVIILSMRNYIIRKTPLHK